VNIILFSTADWDNPFWTNKQHMAKTFEKFGHKVIYIDSLGIRKPKASKSDFFRILKRFKSLFKPYKKVSDNIWVVSPFVIPLYRFKIVQIFNNIFLSLIVKILMIYLQFDKFIVWTYSPVTNSLIDKFNTKLKIYHCVDDLSALPNVDKEILKQKELNLIQKCNFVFTTSKNLYNYIKPYNFNTYYQNNVCDYEHFSKAKMKNYDLPIDLKNTNHPIIIFVGAISSYKIDFELISTIAKRNPNWNFVMIGKIGEGQPETKINQLEQCHNINFLGSKDYDELPKYLHFADVAIIPANINDYTKSMFPMKFFEYLSAGLQVVTTNLHSLDEYKSISFISKNIDDFENNLRTVIENNIKKNKEEIEIQCKRHTWDFRYKKIMNLIGEY
jgi:hypothetical protein